MTATDDLGTVGFLRETSPEDAERLECRFSSEECEFSPTRSPGVSACVRLRARSNEEGFTLA